MTARYVASLLGLVAAFAPSSAGLGCWMTRASILFVVCLLTILPTACESKSREVVVYTSVDQVFSEPVLREFERDAAIRVRAVFDTEETKSTGVLNRLIAETNRPLADVFWSGDSVRPSCSSSVAPSCPTFRRKQWGCLPRS